MARTNSRRMHLLRTEFFEAGRALDAKGDPAADCWLCKERINYQAPAHTTPDSHNLDHYFTVIEHPELQEDPDNFRHSHMACNGSRGASAPSLGIGQLVDDWW
jgi:hypothetical protein